jgi:hypothetical protein
MLPLERGGSISPPSSPGSGCPLRRGTGGAPSLPVVMEAWVSDSAPRLLQTHTCLLTTDGSDSRRGEEGVRVVAALVCDGACSAGGAVGADPPCSSHGGPCCTTPVERLATLGLVQRRASSCHIAPWLEQPNVREVARGREQLRLVLCAARLNLERLRVNGSLKLLLLLVGGRRRRQRNGILPNRRRQRKEVFLCGGGSMT